MREASETIKETFDIGFGPAGDDNLQPRSQCDCVGQGLQDLWASLTVATLIQCVNDEGERVLIGLARQGKDKIEELCVFHGLRCEVLVTTNTFCYNLLKTWGDSAELIDERGKNVSRLAR